MCHGNPKYLNPNQQQKLLNLILSCGSSRSFDTGYAQFLVANGKIDISVDGYGEIWDIAPYKLMVEEAGGKLTNLEGKEWTFEDKGCIATNGLLHDDVVKILNK